MSSAAFGGAASAAPVTYRTPRIAVVALAALDSGGGVLSWQNPETSDIAVVGIEIDVKTVATGACTIDVGTTASSSTTSSDNLLDGLDVHTGTGLFNNIEDIGANGKSKQRLASGDWVTASMATGAAAGLAGYAYISYVTLS